MTQQPGNGRPITRRDFLILSGAAAAYPFLPGCGGGGGGEPQGDFATARNVVMKPNVIVLPEDGSVGVSGLTDSALTLSGNVPALRPGFMLVSGEGPGFVRRVTAVTPAGTTLALATQPGSLEDLFESAELKFRHGLRTLPGDTIQVHAPGAQVGRGRGGLLDNGIPIVVPEFKIGTEEEGNEFAVKFSASGILNGDIEGDFNFTAANGLERFGLQLTASYDGSFGFSTEAEIAIFKAVEKPFFTHIFTPRKVAQIGPVPIILLPILMAQAVFKGVVKAGFGTSGDGFFHVVTGFTAQKLPSGDYDFSGKFIPSRTGEFNAPNFFGALEVELSPWQLELQTSFDGLIGPVFKADVPGFKVGVQPHPLDRTCDVSVEASFAGKVGAQAGCFGLKLPLFEIVAAEHKIPIKPFPKTFQPGDSAAIVQ